MDGRRTALLLAGLGAAAFAALPAGAGGQISPPSGVPVPPPGAPASPPSGEIDGGGGARAPGPAPAQLRLKLTSGGDGTVRMGDRMALVGTLRPFVPDQRAVVRLVSRGDVAKRKRIRVRRYRNTNVGRFKFKSGRLVEAGKYRFKVVKPGSPDQERAGRQTRAARIVYPDLDPGDHGTEVRILNDLLDRQGYLAPNSSGYGAATGRAVLAARKVNRMSRITNINPALLRRLAAGEAEFKPAYPNSGHHAEVDISRQVLALVDDGKAQYTFHVSTGAPGTPSDRGSFTFYSKQPGFNSVGMYYSIYYNRGEATHGYHSVPNYPASHGCIRNPIPNSRLIYNWIRLGDPMYVYG
jgi:hypothetical protein